MKNLDLIANELFNKVRGRFPSVTIGDQEGKVINQPGLARYFDFDYTISEKVLGKVSISLDEDNVAVMYSNDFITNEDSETKNNWYEFLKELRVFAKKRLLNFDVRNITKNNLNKRDYKFLAQNRPGEVTMESTMYGTSKKSYQEIGNAKVIIQHTDRIQEGQSRLRNIGTIFIESDEGERFKYPYKHINGARALARHVSEGGSLYDDLGQYIVGCSEELNNLKKFKTYMGRSKVMAEGLKDHLPIIKERMLKVKKTIETLQKQNGYHAIKEQCIAEELKEVPTDVKDSWIEQLTVKQFDESLNDIFPYIYNLIATESVKSIGPDDLLGEAGPVDDVEVAKPAETYKVGKGDTMYSIYKKFKNSNFQGYGYEEAEEDIMRLNPDIEDPALIQPGQIIQMPYFMGSGPDGASRGLPPGGFDKYGEEIENTFEDLMGQFSEANECPDCGDSPCSCEDKTDEGNEFAQKVQQMKAAGAKKGDKFKTSDGKEHTLEDVTEYVLSMYDRETGQFPKGETAVLTAIEKDFGEGFINPAKKFIEMVNAKFEEFNGYRDPNLDDDTDIQEANKEAGLNKIKMLYLQNQASDMASQDSIYAPGVKGAAPAGDVDKKAAMIAKKYGITDQELAKIRLDALQSDAGMAAMEDLTRLAGL